MTYGTSNLLIGREGVQGEGKKYCCVRGYHYMKNKNIGGCVLSTQPDQQKRPMRKKRKKYQTLNFFSSLVSLTRHFTKFLFLRQVAAMPQFNMQICFFSFFSKQSS